MPVIGTTSPETFISPDQLTVGIYVHLDLGWMDHPFTFSHFRIKTPDQIDTIRRLGLKRIRVDLGRSTAQPLPPPSKDAPPPPPPAIDASEIEAKRARVEELKQRRQAIAQCERSYIDAAKTVVNISRNLIAKPDETIAEAEKLTHQLAASLLAEQSAVVHLMGDKVLGEEIYYHSLNVSVLSMLIGRALGLSEQELITLGMGGMFHDIGKIKIPHKVLIKADNPTKAEAEFLHLHCQYGVEIAQKVRLPPAVIAIIAQHHELIDGSGYPAGKKGDAIDPLARLLAVTNAYDNLCNPVDVINALTPHEALSLMFSQQRTRFDNKVLGSLIHTLGVYPPGTVVKLSSETLGMIMSVNSDNPLKPCVLIHDPAIPREEAIMLDLTEEPDLTISKAIRPSQLPRSVYDYLSPRTRVSYFFDANKPQKARRTAS